MRIRGDTLPNEQSDFQKCTDEQMLWLKACRDKMVAGDPILLDPFYERTPLLTRDIVTMVLTEIKDKIDHEIKIYGRSHHAKWQGVPAERLRTPRYLDLPFPQQLAIVQGMDRIANRYRMSDEDIAEEERLWREAAEERERKRVAYVAERAANLARDPHFYDNEYEAIVYGC